MTEQPADNYVGPVIERLQQLLPDCPPALVRLYALLALTLGATTARRDVHDAWSIWQDLTQPGHRSLVPFDELTPDVQVMDGPYVAAIRKVAKEMGLA